jgi:putative hemolysin
LGTINQALRVNVLHCSATEQSCEVAMPTANSFWIDIAGLLAILLLVAANGFFVAAEFSLVAVRRSRVTQLVAEGQRRARALSKALDHLDANLAATQLGITISSLALRWIGEPALAHLIQPFLSALGSFAEAAHTPLPSRSPSVITTLHIVLGELTPKSLALQGPNAQLLPWCARSPCSDSYSGQPSSV